MTPYGTNSANIIAEIVDAINQLHKNISYLKTIITGKIPSWFTKLLMKE